MGTRSAGWARSISTTRPGAQLGDRQDRLVRHLRILRPASGASISGGDIVVSYDKETVKNAPRVDPDGHLSPDEEQALYDYYGVGGSATAVDRDVDYDRDADTTARTDTTVGHDTSGPTTDDAMTLSEERVNVGTQTREAGRARLRKYVVTENVTQTVPVQP